MSHNGRSTWEREARKRPGVFDNYRQLMLFLLTVVGLAGVGAAVIAGLVVLVLVLIGAA